jgi:hypothetical protein
LGVLPAAAGAEAPLDEGVAAGEVVLEVFSVILVREPSGKGRGREPNGVCLADQKPLGGGIHVKNRTTPDPLTLTPSSRLIRIHPYG